MSEVTFELKLIRHAYMAGWALLQMWQCGETADTFLGDVSLQIIDGKLEKVTDDFKVVKQHKTFVAEDFNLAVDKFNAGEINFGDIIELD